MYQYFKGSYSTIQEVKNEYRKLAFKYHPDKGGSTEIMQKINSEYDKLIKEVNNRSDKKVNINNNLENKFKEIIMELVKLQNITIRIVGFYIWVDGNTKQYKDKLKALGMFWSTNQKQWYYNGLGYKSTVCSRKSWSEITSYFGCVEIQSNKDDKQTIKQLRQAI
jgi:hypothetical protein